MQVKYCSVQCNHTTQNWSYSHSTTYTCSFYFCLCLALCFSFFQKFMGYPSVPGLDLTGNCKSNWNVYKANP